LSAKGGTNAGREPSIKKKSEKAYPGNEKQLHRALGQNKKKCTWTAGKNPLEPKLG